MVKPRRTIADGRARRVSLGILCAASLAVAPVAFAVGTPPATDATVGSANTAEQVSAAVEHFDVWEIQVEGNTLLPQVAVERAVYNHLGEHRTLDDVQAAQRELEDAYHGRGYGSVLVDIPEQDVDGGIVILKVTEAKIARTKVTGSRYFSLGRIRSKVPSLAPGTVPNLPLVQQELAELGKLSSDRVITPVLKPSRTPGRLDVELKVKDELPLHGSLDLNDRFSADTSRLRLNASIRYDNLWQREHSIGLSYQTSPQAPDEVEVFAANYLWRFENSDHLLSAYAVRSNSNVATVGTLGVLGAGTIAGLRYTVPLPGIGTYYHSVSVGADYKDFQENIGLQGNDTLQTPISYLMFLGTYNGSYFGKSTVSHFELGFNAGPSGFGNTQKEFELKRFKSKPNFAYLRAHLDHLMPLLRGTSFFSRLDGQVADSPLISNEEYAAGGVDSVRGYQESEKQADDALAMSFELRSPNLKPGHWEALQQAELFAFTDAADLHIKSPLPGAKPDKFLWSTGVGVRLNAIEHVQATLIWAHPLKNGDRVRAGDDRVHFNLGYEF